MLRAGLQSLQPALQRTASARAFTCKTLLQDSSIGRQERRALNRLFGLPSGARLASTSGAAVVANDVASAGSAAAATLTDAVTQQALATAVTAPTTASTVIGRFPDYSITVATADGTGWSDRILHVFQLPIEFLHDTVGLPWWGAIVAGSIALRAITLRTQLRAMRSGARMQLHMEEFTAFQKRMQAAQAAGETAQVLVLRGEMREFMKKHHISFGAAFAPLVQIPFLFGTFWAIGRFARDAHLLPDFIHGGTAWFTEMCASDPTLMIPTASVAMSLLSVWANPAMNGIPQAELTPKGQRLLFTTLAGLFSYVTFTFPVVRRRGAEGSAEPAGSAGA